MDTSNIKSARLTGQDSSNESHTTPPQWQSASFSGYPVSEGSGRKLYVLVAAWVIVIGVAVAASIGAGGGTSRRDSQGATLGENAFRRSTAYDDDFSSEGAETQQRPDVPLLNRPGDSMPASFKHTQDNLIDQPQLLQQAAFVLADGERPLRVLHIGDSHVAGKTFPLSVKETLVHCLGQAESAGEGQGVWFNYIGSNGATSARFLSEKYMAAFAEKSPDLIIVSLGTNEAHSMNYREDIHEKQLDAFFERLGQACPDAAILLTTPPGDYLSSSYVSYRQTSRSRHRQRQVRYAKRPNPMNARCASFIADYGHGNHMAVWDLFTICGGETAAHANWTGSGLMRSDRIHFEHEGYAIQGHLLGEAIVRALAE